MDAPPPPSGGLGFVARDVPFGPTVPPPGAASARGASLRTALIALLVLAAALGGLGYSVHWWVERAKEAEARSELQLIAVRARVVFESTGHLCGSASQPVPREMPSSLKYQSSAREWLLDAERNAGFACLGFERAAPQHYQYRYEATATSFTATARGQLQDGARMRELRATGSVVGGALVIHTPD